MGWASERQIEIHNEKMESDEEYRADYERWCEDRMREQAMEEPDDLFGYRLDHAGYEEVVWGK